MSDSKDENHPYFESHIALAGAWELYRSPPQAEADLDPPATLREEDDAYCGLDFVLLFETCHLDLNPHGLRDVLAISSANNIYAAELVSCGSLGPHQLSQSRHLIGNVGKPGLALLLLPGLLDWREPDLETWEPVSHTKFDGKFEDSLQSTSLHLSLRGYKQSLDVGHHGAFDREVIYVEAVMSVHDRGTWVAEINPLYVMRGPKEYLATVCQNDPKGKEQVTPESLTSIDNWFEYLDLPGSAGIIRSRGNWTACPAFASIPTPNKQNLFIGSESIC